MNFTLGAFQVNGDVLVLGAITGMVYGVLGVGLVLVYRTNRIINFAHGEIGALGAAVLGTASINSSVPYWVLFVAALAVSAIVGAAADRVVINRLRHAPLIVSVIATLGLGAALSTLAAVINSTVGSGQNFPQPPGLPSFTVGALRVTPAYSAMLFVTPAVVLALAVFLRRGRLGLSIRAAAANPDTARMAGVRPDLVSALAWGIAGSLAAYTAILILPTRGITSIRLLGPALILRALTAAVIGRMVSLPITMAAGVGIGVLEGLLLANYRSTGPTAALMFCIILVALLLQPARTGRSEDKGSWAVVQSWSPLPESYKQVFAIRNLGWIVFCVTFAIALIMPVIVSNATAVVFVSIISFALVGVSLGVVTGLGGQLSLGQFALAGVGATVSYVVTSHGGNFVVGVLAAGFAAAVASLVIGVPALRIRGLMLAVVTLSFALAAESWLFGQSWMLGSGVLTRRPAVGHTTFDSGRSYYFIALAALVVGLWLTRNVWRGALGRKLRAVRDNEDAARAFTIPATIVKIQAFLVAGFLAGLGGAIYGHFLARLDTSAFPTDSSINVAAAVVLGGLGMAVAPLLGALYIIGVPRWLPLDSAGLTATSLGWLILILNYPGGITQSLAGVRQWVVDRLARWAGLNPVAERPASTVDGSASSRASIALPPSDYESRVEDTADVALEADRVTKRFGGLTAVDGASLVVRSGETLGLIGPNGAGKTTMFEVLSGFTRPDEGSITFRGEDITSLSPEKRGRLGLIRSFQDAALFPTLTVLDSVILSLERANPTRFVSSVLGLTASERRKALRAQEFIGVMGLHSYRHRRIRELSTGTRRITELACLIALEPRVLLLDEPTSGIAQRETEALGALLEEIKEQLRLTLVVIEHDIPLILGISDRIVVMESGRVIADGAPAAVASDPAVVASYLGTDVLPIARSDGSVPSKRRRVPSRR